MLTATSKMHAVTGMVRQFKMSKIYICCLNCNACCAYVFKEKSKLYAFNVLEDVGILRFILSYNKVFTNSENVIFF